MSIRKTTNPYLNRWNFHHLPTQVCFLCAVHCSLCDTYDPVCGRGWGNRIRFLPLPQQITAPPSGYIYTSLSSFFPFHSSLLPALCVSVPVGSSAMLNASFPSLPRQELICEIIYLPVYFKHWEDTLLIVAALYNIYGWLQTEALCCMSCFNVCINICISLD